MGPYNEDVPQQERPYPRQAGMGSAGLRGAVDSNPLIDALSRLDNTMSELDQISRSLEVRLQPVLRVGPEVAQYSDANKTSTPESQIVQAVNLETGRTREIIGRLATILDRLEL